MKNKAIGDAKEAVTLVPKTRVRLLPQVRRRQILDAALIEFSSLGFTAASISRIAERAGTSKANLYVHFANKDEIFETLLRDLLEPSKGFWQQAQIGHNLDELIDAFIEASYDGLTPQTLAVIRLVISESHRVPALILRWHKDTMMPSRVEQQRQIDAYVAAGQICASPLTENFSFIMAPVLYAAVFSMVFPPDIAEIEFLKTKETHRKVLRLLLKVQSDNC